MAALGVFGFVLASISLALVLGSGAGRFVEPDDPTMLWVGLGFFAAFLLVGGLVKVIGPEEPPTDNRWGVPTMLVLALAGVVAGVALDISN